MSKQATYYDSGDAKEYINKDGKRYIIYYRGNDIHQIIERVVEDITDIYFTMTRAKFYELFPAQ